MPRDLLLLVSFMNQFPQASEYTIRAVSNFIENSRRYSQPKVHHQRCWHRWQIEKIFNQKNLTNFVRTPLDSRVNIFINFCLQVHFQVFAAWYCSLYLPPMSLTPAANSPPVSLTPVANLPLVSTTPTPWLQKVVSAPACMRKIDPRFESLLSTRGALRWATTMRINGEVQ